MTVDPFAPRPIDLPTTVPLEPDADLAVLDEAKILAAPENPRDRPAWRAALHRWRDEARARTSYDGSGYDDPDTAWAATAWNVAMVWLWDEVAPRLGRRALRRRRAARGLRRRRRPRRGRALARLPRHRDRRPQPVRLVRRARPPRAGRRPACAGGQGLPRLQPVGRRHPARRCREDGRRTAGGPAGRAGRRRAVPGHPQGGRPGAAGDHDRARAPPGARGRVAGAAGADRGPPGVVGAVVRGQRRARRAAGALVRAAPPDAPHPPLEP